MCETFLLTYHKSEITNILENQNDKQHFSVDVNFVVLFDHDPTLGNKVLKEPDDALDELQEALIESQKKVKDELENKSLLVKTKAHCRIFGLPTCPELSRTVFPKIDDVNKFLQVSGTVIRMTDTKVLEVKRNYLCSKCKHKFTCHAIYTKRNMIIPPKRCPNPDYCKSTHFVPSTTLDSEACIDYQEIKLQEQMSQMFGTMPCSIWLTLDNDLVGSCKPGDNVTVCGTVKQRWTNLFPGKSMDIEIAIKANHVQVNNVSGMAGSISVEVKETFKNFWERYKYAPILGRDFILKSFCPQIFGMYIVKLAMVVTLAGGSQIINEGHTSSGVRTRSEPHLLLVGDPGTGKSHLLRFAAKVTPRSVLTTGVGSTAAGLTATAHMENGGWQIEGGALVLADGGVCCIDEFNSMREHDRTSILEAMEQQTISVAKASIVSKLSTRCSIIAAGNAKTNIDPYQPLSVTLALPSPLLSRFDLILLIRDTVRQDWDRQVANYILNGQKRPISKFTDNNLWTAEMLQSYFSIIRKKNPLLSDSANRILGNYYQLQRKQTDRNKARTTVRLLDSLIRLSQGHARLLFHDQVEIIDAVTAIMLIEMGMGSRDDSVLNLNVDMHDDFPDDSLRVYMETVADVLGKLDAEDLVEVEFRNLEKGKDVIVGRDGEYRAESKYFRKNIIQKSVSSEETDVSCKRVFKISKSMAQDEVRNKNELKRNEKSEELARICDNSHENIFLDKKDKASHKTKKSVNEDKDSINCSEKVFKISKSMAEDKLQNETPESDKNIENTTKRFTFKARSSIKNFNTKSSTLTIEKLTDGKDDHLNNVPRKKEFKISKSMAEDKLQNDGKTTEKLTPTSNGGVIKNPSKRFTFKPRNLTKNSVKMFEVADDDFILDSELSKVAKPNVTDTKDKLTVSKSFFEDDLDVDLNLDSDIVLQNHKKSSKSPKFQKHSKNKFLSKNKGQEQVPMSDFQMINLMPSVNDGLDFEFLNEDYDLKANSTGIEKRRSSDYLENDAKKTKLSTVETNAADKSKNWKQWLENKFAYVPPENQPNGNESTKNLFVENNIDDILKDG